MEGEASRLLLEEEGYLVRGHDRREQGLRVLEWHLDEDSGVPDSQMMIWVELESERFAQDGQQDRHYWK